MLRLHGAIEQRDYGLFPTLWRPESQKVRDRDQVRSNHGQVGEEGPKTPPACPQRASLHALDQCQATCLTHWALGPKPVAVNEKCLLVAKRR